MASSVTDLSWETDLIETMEGQLGDIWSKAIQVTVRLRKSVVSERGLQPHPSAYQLVRRLRSRDESTEGWFLFQQRARPLYSPAVRLRFERRTKNIE